VGAESEEVVGLAAQELYLRPLKKVKRVTSAKRKQKLKRETDVWGRVIDRVNRAPEGACFIHICDRGADNFDVFCHLLEQQAGWVIRAAQLKRRVRDDANRECSLEDALHGQAVLGSYELKVPANHDQPARTAHMEIRYAPVVMPRPKTGISRYVRDCGVKEIPMGLVETREVNPPRGVTALRWELLTSEPVHGFADAWRIIGWYEKRPLIEEYHKCLKTGCSVEARQYRTGDRLAPIIGLLSVVAVRLLQLKMVARQEPERPAARVVPTNWLAALPHLLKRPKPVVTVRDFFRGLASLGGFLGRKSDGEPRLANGVERPRNPTAMPPRCRSPRKKMWVIQRALPWADLWRPSGARRRKQRNIKTLPRGRRARRRRCPQLGRRSTDRPAQCSSPCHHRVRERSGARSAGRRLKRRRRERHGTRSGRQCFQKQRDG
jgi:hypothetical protein